MPDLNALLNSLLFPIYAKLSAECFSWCSSLEIKSKPQAKNLQKI